LINEPKLLKEDQKRNERMIEQLNKLLNENIDKIKNKNIKIFKYNSRNFIV